MASLGVAVPPALEQLVHHCLAKDPAARIGSAQAVIEALDAVAQGESRNEAAGVPSGRPWGRRPLVWVAGVVLAVLLAALAWGAVGRRAAGGPPLVRSVAVLPLENLSGDPDQDYFAAGMTDALIAELSRLGALKVISRTSAMRYQGTTLTVPEIAAELGSTRWSRARLGGPGLACGSLHS